MILAEKITMLRKQNGWSQEELAMRLNISRQSVSKWESTASIPDLDKIIKLSEIFGVSTDCLLKDELEVTTEVAPLYEEDFSSENDILKIDMAKKVSLEEANQYMNLAEGAAKKIALGVSACIISPILVILLGGLSEYQVINMTDGMAGGIGSAMLFLIIAGAVVTFIVYGMQLDKFQYIESDLLDLEYGVAGIVEVKRDNFEPVFKKCIPAGVALCILSVVPLLVAAAFQAPEIVFVFCVALLLLIIAFGVYLFVWSGMIWGSYQKLLEEGDYTREKKLENKRNDNLSKVYWCTTTAIYLGISFLTGNWHITWVIWPCAGVLYAAVCGIAAMIRKK